MVGANCLCQRRSRPPAEDRRGERQRHLRQETPSSEGAGEI